MRDTHAKRCVRRWKTCAAQNAPNIDRWTMSHFSVWLVKICTYRWFQTLPNEEITLPFLEKGDFQVRISWTDEAVSDEEEFRIIDKMEMAFLNIHSCGFVRSSARCINEGGLRQRLQKIIRKRQFHSLFNLTKLTNIRRLKIPMIRVHKIPAI